ncbi:MAG TPA: COX15/CtaA family protein [Thermoanaerobaculales bacterium]|nr:COX15/CtaA family protein [Thermoanaerobaculales bacterium]HPA81375.1 COX15/CtaA family protein [Thermoanaerobaculales bacterium]HQL30105.1 COX15/CtaA family protein [Thermoanaerobaculales bacterium]HQN94790.1 COX15/CtaA family protein [Thermoanaerobaculales bacterium]HQP43172.1 COX15/CtaA family protein [Thermoanaerobaculales bacterium]
MPAARDPRTDRGSAVALGLATAVTMWAIAYVGRLPAVMAPSAVIALAMLAAVVGWGWFAGRRTARWGAGVAGGAVAGLVNLLILGSLIVGPDGGPRWAMLWWVPASVAAVAALAGASAALASAAGALPAETDWTAMLTKVAVAASFLLVVAGGLVTSNEAGLAVVDWPNTFGSNMFLYPLSRMTGGIFYEHAHRLFGTLVGLATLAVAVRLWRTDARSWVRVASALAVVVVAAQGLLGGLRVTGRLTLSTAAEDMAPSIGLAVLHGVLGQVFLALMVALAAVTSRRWRSAPAPEPRPSAAGDRALQAGLIGALLVQLVLGAIQRHLAQGLLIHITLAAIVTIVAIAAGARAWGLYQGSRPVERLGQALMSLVAVQVALGIAALAVTQGRAVVGQPTTLEVTLATAHQAAGAGLLSFAVLLAAWTRRLYRDG